MVSNYKNGQPIDNALHLTWEDPLEGIEDVDSFVIMRKRGYEDYDDLGYVCVARLAPSVHAYTDSCLDGAYWYSYKLVSYHYSDTDLHRGCSLPLEETGYVDGYECPSPPNRPDVYSCDSCILKWRDNSYNEDGFIIERYAEIVGEVGPDTTRFYVTNCNTGDKHGYAVGAHNIFGIGRSQPSYYGCNSTLTIVSPNGGEELIPGDFHEIVWTRELFYGPVKLEYSTDDGANWITIDDTTENDGFYYWEVPQSPSSLCRVMVYDVVDSMPRDSSDNSFTICNAGICNVNPATLDFGMVDLGDSSQMEYTITNTGCGTVSGSITACPPEFSVSPSSYNLAPNESLTITVTFKPQELGVVTCHINNIGGGCSNVYCSGHGIIDNGGGGGGCPFLFVWNGMEFEEDNTILAACEINPDVAVTDYYMLSKTLVPTNKEYRVQIREFEDQVTYIDRVKLVAVDHTADIKVAVTPEGRIFGYDKELVPITCVDQDGKDHLSKIKRKDGFYFTSEEPGYLVITYSIRTLWPNVLYDPPPIGGNSAQPPWQKRAGITSHVVVEVQDIHGEWHKAGDVPPRFHPERSYWIVGTGDLELGEEFKVKLSWDAYYAADELKYYIRSKEQPINVWSHAVAAVNSEGREILREMLNSDGEYATLMPSQTIELSFPVLSYPESGMVRDFVMQTTGYYVNLKRPPITPSSFALLYNYPNPFNASTLIPYNLAHATDVRLEVFNLTGQRVRLLVDEHQSAGNRKAVWDGKDDKGMDVSSGVYFYRLETDNYSDSKKMVLVR